MKAKLIKLQNGEYDLLIDTNLKNLAGTKLSLKNCQAIERGYDLEDLATDAADNYDASGNWHVAYELFKAGFQKALELMGDKKFTLEDMMNCWNKALKFQEHKETLGEHIQSLQQKEWDVEVEMKPVFDIEYSNNGHRTEKFNKTEYRPKLDADGCLILKTFKSE